VEEYVILDNALERQKTLAHISADLNQALRLADNPNIACRVGVFDVAFCLEVMEYIWNPVVGACEPKPAASGQRAFVRQFSLCVSDARSPWA
jgi:hypothetical protein